MILLVPLLSFLSLPFPAFRPSLSPSSVQIKVLKIKPLDRVEVGVFGVSEGHLGIRKPRLPHQRLTPLTDKQLLTVIGLPCAGPRAKRFSCLCLLILAPMQGGRDYNPHFIKGG